MSLIKGKIHLRRTTNIEKEPVVFMQMVIPEPWASMLLKEGELDKIGFAEFVVSQLSVQRGPDAINGEPNSVVPIKYF